MGPADRPGYFNATIRPPLILPVICRQRQKVKLAWVVGAYTVLSRLSVTDL